MNNNQNPNIGGTINNPNPNLTSPVGTPDILNQAPQASGTVSPTPGPVPTPAPVAPAPAPTPVPNPNPAEPVAPAPLGQTPVAPMPQTNPQMPGQATTPAPAVVPNPAPAPGMPTPTVLPGMAPMQNPVAPNPEMPAPNGNIPPAPNPDPNNEPKKGGSKFDTKTIILVVAAIIAVIICVLYFMFFNPNKKKTTPTTNNNVTENVTENTTENTNQTNNNTTENVTPDTEPEPEEIADYDMSWLGSYENDEATIDIYYSAPKVIDISIKKGSGAAQISLDVTSLKEIVYEDDFLGDELSIKLTKTEDGIIIDSSSTDKDSEYNISGSFAKVTSSNDNWSGFYETDGGEIIINQIYENGGIISLAANSGKNQTLITPYELKNNSITIEAKSFTKDDTVIKKSGDDLTVTSEEYLAGTYIKSE